MQAALPHSREPDQRYGIASVTGCGGTLSGSTSPPLGRSAPIGAVTASSVGAVLPWTATGRKRRHDISREHRVNSGQHHHTHGDTQQADTSSAVCSVAAARSLGATYTTAAISAKLHGNGQLHGPVRGNRDGRHRGTLTPASTTVNAAARRRSPPPE